MDKTHYNRNVNIRILLDKVKFIKTLNSVMNTLILNQTFIELLYY